MDIRLINVCKSYGEKRVLHDFQFTFPEGKTTCMMGPSGCGKTTLLRLLMGLEAPDSGEILGMENRKLSAVFQEDRLCENLGAVSNLRLVNPNLSRQEAEQALGRLGLSGVPRQPVREFSGGMKRRTAILRALCADYDLLLADEPFQGLDAAAKLQAMEYFKASAAGKTVILVTHDEQEAAFFGGELLSMPALQ